jgi:hypothetical protein
MIKPNDPRRNLIIMIIRRSLLALVVALIVGTVIYAAGGDMAVDWLFPVLAGAVAFWKGE